MDAHLSIVADFTRNLHEKFPETHKQYAGKLVLEMQNRNELILDFNGLQASIDPAPDLIALGSADEVEEKKFNYEEVLTTYFSTHGVLSNLLTFKLRGFERAGPDFSLADGLRQLHSLTELDLGGNNLSEIQNNLQLWALTEMRTLKLDSTRLKELPPSIGRLRKLEYLSLSDNDLSTLPITLGFCQGIKYLNLSKNSFNVIPGVVLHLNNLKDLRRLDNPLLKRWNGFEHFPHMTTTSLKPIQKRNADSLQALSAKTIMTTHVDYWSEDSLPPLQCKMLDSFAFLYTYCENCHSAINTKGNSGDCVITAMIPKFADLRDVPFSVHSCTNCCSIIKEHLTDRQKKVLKEMDEEYEESMREAMEKEGIVFERVPVSKKNSTRRHRGKKCSIM